MVLKHLPSVHSHSRSWSMLERQRAKCDKIDEDVRYSSTHTYLCSLRILFSLSLSVWSVFDFFHVRFWRCYLRNELMFAWKKSSLVRCVVFFFSHWIYKVLKIVRWNNSRWCECVRERERRLHWYETPPDNSQHWHHRFQFCFIPLLYHFNSFRISLFYFSLSLEEKTKRNGTLLKFMPLAIYVFVLNIFIGIVHCIRWRIAKSFVCNASIVLKVRSDT